MIAIILTVHLFYLLALLAFWVKCTGKTNEEEMISSSLMLTVLKDSKGQLAPVRPYKTLFLCVKMLENWVCSSV